MMKRALMAVVILAGVVSAATYPMVLKYPKFVQAAYSSGTPGVGTPFAVLVGIRSDTMNVFYYKPRLLQSGSGTARYNFWVDSTAAAGTPNTWQTESYTWTYCPQCTVKNTVDTAFVWTEMKCISTIAEKESIKMTARRVGTTNNIYVPWSADSVQAMDMTVSGTGGWLAGHVYATSSGPLLQNYVVLAYDNDTIVGSCITEDNRINEGYATDPGFFLMACRAGSIDSISVYGRTSFTTPSAHYTQIAPPWTVVAGDTTWVEGPAAGPTIEGVVLSPTYPISVESPLVSARIFESGTQVDSARLLYAANDTSTWIRALPDSVRVSDSTYIFHLPPQDTGATVYWHLGAWTSAGTGRTAVASYAIPLDHSIHDIQFVDTLVSEVTPDLGRYVHTMGVVTGVVTQGRFYIGDVGGGAWNGLHVYRGDTISDPVQVGELLSVIGSVSEYHGLSQINNPLRIIHHAAGLPFDTTTVSIAEARQEAFEGALIRLDTIDVLASGTFVTGNYSVTDYSGTDTAVIYVTAGSQFVGTAIPDDWATLVCNVSDYDGRELAPRVPGDIFTFVPDVAATALLSPDTVSPGQSYTPVIEVRNLSTVGTAANFTAGFRIGGVYSIQQVVASLAPGEADTLIFDPWTATVGVFTTRAYTGLPLDPVPSNDTLFGTLRVAGGATGAWTPIGLIPLAPSGKQSKDGAWMVEIDDQFYVSKGYKTEDMYRYDPAKDSWYSLPGMPRGIENKPPSKGGCAAVGDNGVIYAVKGNNTPAFYSFDPQTETWTQLADVPLGLSNKKVKGGTDILYYKPQGRPDSTWLYLLKGYKTEFYRYSIQAGTWEVLPDAPAGVKPKWDRGSWMVLDANPGHDRFKILAHKAKYHEFYRFDIPAGTWDDTILKPMPLPSTYTGKSRKTKEGAALLVDGAIFAFKAANTQELWKYYIDGDSWVEQETMPAVGPSGRKKRVKAGCDLLAYNGLIYALKGNKSGEMWFYNPAASVAMTPSTRPVRDGVAARTSGIPAAASLSCPAVVTTASAVVRYSLPAGGSATVRLFGADGRLVVERSQTLGRSGRFELNVGGLPAGVYTLVLKLPAGDLSSRFALVR
jgi:hypothetical protein